MQFFTLYSPTRDAELYACSFPTRQARIMLLGRLSTTVVGGQDAPGHYCRVQQPIYPECIAAVVPCSL
jgi:hypothetical protein